MSFIASYANQVTIASGGGTVTVPVPQLTDVSGNGFSGNAYSHYQVGAGPPIAIPAGVTGVLAVQGASAQILYFGKVGET
jgi:hypothetical protein